MAYVRKQWVDRSVQFPGRYAKSGETSTLVTLTESPGTVTQAGTPLNAANMNNIEDGIEERATWDAMRAAEREIAALKMVSTLKDKVDGASDYFYDDFAGAWAPKGSALEIDRVWNAASAAISVGQTVIPLLYNFSTRFLVGQEVTIQSTATETTRERRVITAVDPTNNTITVSPGTTNGYSIGALIYRSWANKATNAMKFKTAYRFQQFDTSGTNIPGTQLTGTRTPSGGNVYDYYGKMSYDGEYIVDAVSPISFGSTDVWTIKKRFVDKYETLFTIPWSILQTVDSTNTTVRDWAMSPDGVYFYILHHNNSTDVTGNFITCVKRIGDTGYQFLQRVDMTSFNGVYPGTMQFSPKGNYLALCMGNSTQFLRVYKRTGDSIGTACSVDIQASVGPLRRVVWSYDEQWIMTPTVNYSSSNGAWVLVYRNVSDTFTKQAASTIQIGTTYGPNDFAFSKDGQWAIVIVSSSSSQMSAQVYKITGTTWTLNKTIPANTIMAFVTISPDNLYFYTFGFQSASMYRWNLTDTTTTSTTVTYAGGAAAPINMGSSSFRIFTDYAGNITWTNAHGPIANISGNLEVLQVDVRYNAKSQTKPIRGIVAFVKRLNTIVGTVTPTISATPTTTEVYAGMTKVIETIDANTALDTSTYVVPNGAALANVTLKLNFTRTATNQDTTITEITGALE
ncbi:hypothetical protein [Paenibacillus glycanilyticus]|uniref:hypothetical protein n=1 Tax=Paenibacillus glycanilyticus TaxID=126569 RepID=UPI0019102922|nr:hypothetical protein [Paenibacillus glycanilyticus]